MSSNCPIASDRGHADVSRFLPVPRGWLQTHSRPRVVYPFQPPFSSLNPVSVHAYRECFMLFSYSSPPPVLLPSFLLSSSRFHPRDILSKVSRSPPFLPLPFLQPPFSLHLFSEGSLSLINQLLLLKESSVRREKIPFHTPFPPYHLPLPPYPPGHLPLSTPLQIPPRSFYSTAPLLDPPYNPVYFPPPLSSPNPIMAATFFSLYSPPNCPLSFVTRSFALFSLPPPPVLPSGSTGSPLSYSSPFPPYIFSSFTPPALPADNSENKRRAI